MKNVRYSDIVIIHITEGPLKMFDHVGGKVVDCRETDQQAINADRPQLEYLVKLSHSEKWFTEDQLEIYKL